MKRVIHSILFFGSAYVVAFLFVCALVLGVKECGQILGVP